MENYLLEKDIPVALVPAASFPDGVWAAHQKLHGLFGQNRHFFGLSRARKEGTPYYAAAEIFSADEAEKHQLETSIIKAGEYYSFMIHDYMEQPENIKQAFDVLLEEPWIDHEAYCVEWYLSEEDLRCMVRQTEIK